MEQVLNQFREFLHRQSLRSTNVREGIVQAILRRRGHFDIEEIVDDLRARGGDASRATVYRTLPLLIAAGIIQETVSPGERHRYEAAVGQEHHDHLVCTRCGRILEFHFEAFEVLQREVANKYGFELTGHSHELFGVCGHCQPRSRAR